MQADFNMARTGSSEAEKALTSWGFTYVAYIDGSIVVREDLNISNKGLRALPDLSCVTVLGDFNCENNALTSLKGAPKSVWHKVNVSRNNLVSLEHAPETGGDFDCRFNRLTSLEGAPARCCGFFCSGNPLASLLHAPKIFSSICSDFGWFPSPDALPLNLCMPAEAFEKAVRGTVVLQKPLNPGPALRFKMK
jgi:hypothetical protein